MHREVLRLKAAEGKADELRDVLKELCSIAEESPACYYSKVYAETNDPGRFFIDQEFESKEALGEVLHSEQVAHLDAKMKTMLCDGMSIVLEEI